MEKWCGEYEVGSLRPHSGNPHSTKIGLEWATLVGFCSMQFAARLVEVKESGAPGEIRTPDLLLRRQPLYPAELRAHGWLQSTWVGRELQFG